MISLPFFDRCEEAARLHAFFEGAVSSLAVIFGRRRCGKSRLLQEVLPSDRSIYYVADDREEALQRTALAREIGRRLPGFERVTYPDWDTLFARWWDSARPGMVLAIDELPSLVAAAGEIPSLLQKYVDRRGRGPHLVLLGSSQRMMQGLVLDRTAPLFGRASEILKISPLACGWIKPALSIRSDVAAVEAYSVWGGVPRYWELAADRGVKRALRELVLSPLGALHEEPTNLLLDDLRDVTQASSILSLIGQGCHRLSEIAARLGKPATSLSRPMQRLIELELVRRDLPYGESTRDSKRTLYRIDDPFLRFWFRLVEPNRSRLEAGQAAQVAREIQTAFPHHVAGVWEELVRASVPRKRYFSRNWKTAHAWWGAGRDQKPLEIDLVAESSDGRALLIGEVKWSDRSNAVEIASRLRQKAEQLPIANGRDLFFAVWSKRGAQPLGHHAKSFDPSDVIGVLR